tara:strand:+ start:1520 stop:1738 length:219 start_codon:yes stop_codon:yes gene_type:complete
MRKATLQTDGTWKIEEFTSEETSEYNKHVSEDKTMKDADIAAAAKKAADRASGKAKLKELGLTDDQIAALIG